MAGKYNILIFPIGKYEKELSPFGKKVLHTITRLRKIESEYNSSIQPQPLSACNKKVLNFRNSNTIYNNLAAPHYQNYTQDQITCVPADEAIHDDSADIKKSSDLIKTIKQNVNEYNPMIKNNVVSQRNVSSHDDLVSNINVSVSVRKQSNTSILETDINLRRDDSKVVAWDDMFDTELIMSDDIDKNETITKRKDEIGKIYTDCKPQVDNLMKKRTKAKKQSLITDTAKKIKQCTELKSVLRKQNYLKTIKDWLKDVPSDKSINENVAENDYQAEHKEGVVENTRKNKKEIQTQLANKDGTMKFSLPKKMRHKKTEQLLENDIENNHTATEIIYEIPCAEEHIPNVINEEVIAVLTYCNGFSQLNCQYTDDACVPNGIMVYVNKMFYYFKTGQEDLRKPLMQLLKHNEVICYDGKHILIYLIDLVGEEIFKLNIIDAKIGGSLLDPDNPPQDFKGLQKLLAFVPGNTSASESTLHKCAWYTAVLRDCVGSMKRMLLETSLWNVFVNVEMKLLPVLADMEHRGLKVDLEKLKSMEDIISTKIKKIEQECYKAAGKTFVINSSIQVSAILYDELKLDARSNVKIRETICKGAKSTSEIMLRRLVSVHPLPKLLLEYRQLHKARSTFLAGIAQHVKDGVVRPTWEQSAAATGRIASSNPNLQAIPKAASALGIFSDTGDTGGPLLNFRSVYIPREGFSFLAADFKHVECRVFAHAAADTTLLELLADDKDLFKALAAKWLNKLERDVTSEDRERTKRIVYASLYGAGARKLMDILGMSYEQTLAVTASFHRTFPCLKSFGRSVVSRCERNGGTLSTVCGRVRRFKNISSSDYTAKSQAERQAVNFIIQGSAADLCKTAMVMTRERLRSPSEDVQAHLVLQIHDELVWEVKHQDLDKAAVIIKDAMENCGRQCGMSGLLPVSISVGSGWGDMTELTL